MFTRAVHSKMAGSWKQLLFLFVSCALIFSVIGQAQNFGTGDISNFLKDEGFVKKQISCVLGELSCDNFGNQLKCELINMACIVAIPEVVSRNCRSCNPQQASNARRLISHVQTKYPQQWQKIYARYKG